MNEQHTPGPWIVAEAVGNKHSSSQMRRIRCAKEGTDHGAVCEVYGVSDVSIAAANARLIVAAPSLLAALKALRASVNEIHGYWTESIDNNMQLADEAIAEATPS